MDRSLHPERIIRLGAVVERTGPSRSTLYRKVADGSFPRQIAISRRCVGWRASELEVRLHNPVFFHVDELPRR
ncbi:helix-turn-helix transcriptional regulator [Sphingomonas sp. 8AM]|uniref:helix-turn-helix transcriptional regulator n=1 Tax=Sphingomonas sp. 8AM TaxID=2653170 RepID=UPI0012F1EE5B|nr:AlpA family phage regulatory protein [Sphingomonas sp. 8AM]VXD01346.1 AlpA family transcriptional regulator [Sphingomonas sp. 8AM]